MNQRFSCDFWANRDGRPNDAGKQVALAWELAYSRPAAEDEVKQSLEFLAQQVEFLKHQQGEAQDKQKSDHPLSALTNFCQVLLSSNGFLYVD